MLFNYHPVSKMMNELKYGAIKKDERVLSAIKEIEILVYRIRRSSIPLIAPFHCDLPITYIIGADYT